MRENADSRAALLIVGGHLLQAVARGDTVAAEGHAEVYRAILKSTEWKTKAGE